MSKETYNLILNSQISTNRIGSNKRNYQYFINWNAILPNKYKKFSVRFSFITISTSSFGEVWTISIDFNTSNLYDNNSSRNNYLGSIFPILNNSASTSGTNTFLLC